MLVLMIKGCLDFYCTIFYSKVNMALLINVESTEPMECFMHTLLSHLIIVFKTAIMMRMMMISQSEPVFEM